MRGVLRRGSAAQHQGRASDRLGQEVHGGTAFVGTPTDLHEGHDVSGERKVNQRMDGPRHTARARNREHECGEYTASEDHQCIPPTALRLVRHWETLRRSVVAETGDSSGRSGERTSCDRADATGAADASRHAVAGRERTGPSERAGKRSDRVASATFKTALHQRPEEERRPEHRQDQEGVRDRQGSQSLSVSRTLTSSKLQTVDTYRLLLLRVLRP